jgi:hypothetical protein
MVSDLLLAIREVDEVIHLQEEIVVAGLCKWWGSMPCDPILTENTPAHLGSNAFQAASFGHKGGKPSQNARTKILKSNKSTTSNCPPSG